LAQSVVLLILGSVAAGTVAGAFYGFCQSAHAAAIGGHSFSSSNKLVRLLTAEKPSLSLTRAFLILLSLAGSLVLFFGTFMIPAALAAWLRVPDGWFVPVAYAALLIAAFIGWQFGAHACRAIL